MARARFRVVAVRDLGDMHHILELRRKRDEWVNEETTYTMPNDDERFSIVVHGEAACHKFKLGTAVYVDIKPVREVFTNANDAEIDAVEY